VPPAAGLQARAGATYGLRFKHYLPTPLPDRHKVLTSGKADVSIVFSTDGQIAADDLLVLEDDKKLFPPYNVSLVVNDKAAQRAGPDLPKIVAQVQQDLSTKVMQELNSRVDLDKERPAAVAREYLQQFGYTDSARPLGPAGGAGGLPPARTRWRRGRDAKQRAVRRRPGAPRRHRPADAGARQPRCGSTGPDLTGH
jgi:hypothetical protein